MKVEIAKLLVAQIDEKQLSAALAELLRKNSDFDDTTSNNEFLVSMGFLDEILYEIKVNTELHQEISNLYKTAEKYAYLMIINR